MPSSRARFVVAVAVLAVSAAPAAARPTPAARAQAWWADIAAIADDSTEGRLTGSPGYLKAAAYVERRFRALGLAPAGSRGYRQMVAFQSQTVDQAASKASLDGSSVKVGEELLISAGGGPRPARAEAELVFIGYGLHLPAQGWDDFAGVDLKGKIAVVVSGGPSNIPGPVKSSNRNERVRLLGERGAVGLISLTTPRQVEIPWARQKLLSGQPGMYLADRTLRETPDGFVSGSFDPERAQRLFEGSGHTWAEIAAAADASGPVSRFALKPRLSLTTAARRTPVSAPNLVARLEGSDPRLRSEHVVLSAHLDHLGVGAAIDGDRIYNGAMDDASGVASVLDIAERLKAGPRPKRSVLFVIVCAEEKGLLGSSYFARRPTVPRRSLVADFNFDMPLPFWPLKTVLVQGEAESTLGDDARAAAEAQGLALTPDPLPERNSFVRTDQFSFVKAGVPALAFKFGFPKGTPAFQIEHDWRANRYHSPSDDLQQPGVLKEEAVKLDDYVAAIAQRVANAAKRPTWLPTSVFRRYAD